MDVSESQKAALSKLLGQVPRGHKGAVRVYLPENMEEDALVEYEGEKLHFPASFWASSPGSQSIPTIVVPSEEKPCL